MTVALQTPYNNYVANGVTTVFAYQFKILASGDLLVYVNGILQTLNVDYSVSGVGADVGGNVTFLAAAPLTTLPVNILRSMSASRSTDYQQLGDFLTTVVNDDFDRAILLIQDLANKIGRAISIPVGEASLNTLLPAAATRAGKYIVFDALGNVSVASTIVGVTLTQALFDSFLVTSVVMSPRLVRGAFTLPATVKFFGDSFWEEPNAHTSSTHSMAFKAAALLGVVGSINATSGNTSADKQDAIFAANPAATDCWLTNLGQNDAQFINTGTDVERRLNDAAMIQLANHFQMGTPAGSRRILASAMTQAGAWSNDADIAEGGSLKSTTSGDTLLANVADARYIVVMTKMKTANLGKFKVIIDGTTYDGGMDDNGFHSYPHAQIPTNTAKTFARYALVFDTGRRKPQTAVQVQVTSTTGAGNVVTVCSVIGLSGDPLAGPLFGVCDLTDRNTAGYATAVGSQAAVPIVSRIGMQSLAVAAACGLRGVALPIAAAINNTTQLDADQFHPNEAGALAGATAMASAITNAARDLSNTRPDLDAQALLNHADGYILMAGRAIALTADFQMKRARLSPRQLLIRAADPFLTVDSFRMGFEDGSGFLSNPNEVFIAYKATGVASDAGVGNQGNGSFTLSAYGNIKVRITQTGIIAPSTEVLAPEVDGVLQLGAFAKQYTTAWFLQYVRTKPTTVALLPAAGGSIEGARWAVTDATQTLTAGIGAVVAGGGANHVPVFCDGTNWRIGG